MTDSEKWYFVCDGDPQVGRTLDEDGTPLIRGPKKNILNQLIKINAETPIDFIICAGDLTEHGWGGGCMPRARPDEFAEYLNVYERPIENAGFELKLCIGNHDSYVDFPYLYKPVIDHVQKKHNTTRNRFNEKKSGCYTFEHQGVLFICMGVYPYYLKWLRKNLPASHDDPVVIFYHYNTNDAEPFSDWWSSEEKEAFYDVIKDHNIILIVNGHFHNTGRNRWHDIITVRGSGSDLILITMEENRLKKIDRR